MKRLDGLPRKDYQAERNEQIFEMILKRGLTAEHAGRTFGISPNVAREHAIHEANRRGYAGSNLSQLRAAMGTKGRRYRGAY